MKNIDFRNDEIKEKYQSLIKLNSGLSGIILSLKNEDITIKDIIDSGDNLTLIIDKNHDIITVDLDLLKKKAYVKLANNEYKIIYDIYPRKYIKPTSYLYQNNDRIIIDSLKYKLATEKDKIKYLELIENGKDYVLILKSNNELISADDFVNQLLYHIEKYNSIRDIFIAITKIFNISDLDLKITDSMGSSIIIKNGVVEKYVEVQEKGKDYQKIFLQDDNFFVEKKVVDEYCDDVTAYIKKLGEINGKEKRKD